MITMKTSIEPPDSVAVNGRVPISTVIFREDLYPRIKTKPELVQKYAEDLSVLPPIEVNQHYELIDGWHRWTAHKKAEAREIRVLVTQTQNDDQLLELAIRRNAQFGEQMTAADKKKVAGRIYRSALPEERGRKKQLLAEILSMSYDTIHRWLSRIDKDTEEERNAAVLNLYLQCYTQEEIAERVGMPRTSVEELLTRICNYEIPSIPGRFAEELPEESATQEVKKKAESARLTKIISENTANAEHAHDFQVPIYNVWRQQDKSIGSEHFGNSEVRWLDNLLYLYTKPFDIVVDPFAGGGSTLDRCKDRFRRCWTSDRKPLPERPDTRELDIVATLPDLRKRWSDVTLVYLDPPYWTQAEGKYSDDPEDLANMPLDQFTETLAGLVRDFAKKLTTGHIALLISPTQWPAPERAYTDHLIDILRLVKLPIEMRFSCPYESQQYNGNQVLWAKENRKCLVLSRELVVWRVG